MARFYLMASVIFIASCLCQSARANFRTRYGYPALIACAFLAAVLFEFHPAIEQARSFIPEHVYKLGACDCRCILDSRPWYGLINHWFWLFVLLVPLCAFSLGPAAPLRIRLLSGIVCAGVSYVLINFSVHLHWHIRNAPFVVSPDSQVPYQETWDVAGCADIADGASLSFALLLGWIPAILYTGLWFFVRKKTYHGNA